MIVGFGLFGAVDQVPGECHVATRFFYVSGIPILPLDSWAVVERKELVSFGFLSEVVTGHNLSEGSARGVRVPFNFKSVLLTYVRAILWVVHGVATAGLVILALGYLIDWFGSRPIDWPGTLLIVLISASAGGGFLLWHSYRRTYATPERARELRALLGLPQGLARPSLSAPLEFQKPVKEARKVGITLFDQKTDEIVFDVNFWHWRAIVEAIRSLGVLPESRVDALHQPFNGELAQDEARLVAAAIRERLLPTLGEDERLLFDGRRTTEPDDGTFYREPAEQHKNYSTNRRVLEEFARCCEGCSGFRVS
jgi:hypothetical protein